MEERFRIRQSPLMNLLGRAYGVTEDRRSVVIADGVLRYRYGWLFEAIVPIGNIESVGLSPARNWGGWGWRFNRGAVVGLIGSLSGQVEVRLRQKQRVTFRLWPRYCAKVIVASLDDPQGFISSLSRAMASVA